MTRANAPTRPGSRTPGPSFTFTRGGTASYIGSAIWNITGHFPARTVEMTLPSAGFSVGSTRGVARVGKYGGAGEFRPPARGPYHRTIPAPILLAGQCNP